MSYVTREIALYDVKDRAPMVIWFIVQVQSLVASIAISQETTEQALEDLRTCYRFGLKVGYLVLKLGENDFAFTSLNMRIVDDSMFSSVMSKEQKERDAPRGATRWLDAMMVKLRVEDEQRDQCSQA